MTDRELLELAAKAAGVEYTLYDGRLLVDFDYIGLCLWNPLEDDGDALRLAVKLNLAISIPVHKTIRADVICFLDSSVNIREENGDPYAATRRAIVRAAAEIGKQMRGSDE